MVVTMADKKKVAFFSLFPLSLLQCLSCVFFFLRLSRGLAAIPKRLSRREQLWQQTAKSQLSGPPRALSTEVGGEESPSLPLYTAAACVPLGIINGLPFLVCLSVFT